MSSSTDTENFRKKIILFSYIFSVGIVCYHADFDTIFSKIVVSNSKIDVFVDFLNVFLDSFGATGLAFFFITSGFLMYYNMSLENMYNKVKRRIKTLLLPLLIWNVIGIFFYNAYNILSGSTIDSGITILFKVLFSNYCGVMWYVEALLLFLIFIPGVYYCFCKKIGTIILLIIWGICWKISVPSVLIFGAELDIQRIVFHIPYYLLGAWAGIRFPNFVMGRYGRKKQIIASVLLIIAFWIYYIKRTNLIFVVPILLWITLDDLWIQLADKWVCQISFSIYAIHIFLLGIFTFILQCMMNVESISVVGAVIGRVILTIITVTMATVIARIMIKVSDGTLWEAQTAL